LFRYPCLSFALGVICLFLASLSIAQIRSISDDRYPIPLRQATPNAAEIYASIQKLNVLGSVLYFAAHPDDENTCLMAWLAKDQHYKTSYLSLTRGDGGQNLIGTELTEELGLIRTQELLLARSIDGGEQYFSRANDFGFSKTPEETLDFWGEQ